MHPVAVKIHQVQLGIMAFICVMILLVAGSVVAKAKQEAENVRLLPCPDMKISSPQKVNVNVQR